VRLYLDDDLDSNALIGLLLGHGHEVTSSRAAGTRGIADEDHLRYAPSRGLALLTANAGDFVELHRAWVEEGRGRFGVLIVYRENNSAKDMTFSEIAQAVTRLGESGVPMANALHGLNRWR
jgi:hypothetical protein